MLSTTTLLDETTRFVGETKLRLPHSNQIPQFNNVQKARKHFWTSSKIVSFIPLAFDKKLIQLGKLRTYLICDMMFVAKCYGSRRIGLSCICRRKLGNLRTLRIEATKYKQKESKRNRKKHGKEMQQEKWQQYL